MVTDTATIRPLKTDDFESVTEVYNLSHAAEYAGETIKFSPESLLDSPVLLELFHASDIFVFDDNGIKGFVGHQNEKIIWLYVDPECQGQKIGLKLINFIMRRLNNVASIIVVKSNFPALNLYKNLGFEVVGEFDFDYQDHSVKALNLVSGQGLALVHEMSQWTAFE